MDSTNSYDDSDLTVCADGLRRYTGLPPSLVHLLAARRDSHSDQPAVGTTAQEAITYRELFDAAARVAGGLHAMGCRRGDRVGLKLPNCTDWVIAYWGILLAGGTVVTIGHKYTDREVDHIVRDSGLEIIIDTDSGLPDGSPTVADDLNEDDIASIFYTSGTTGAPKGVIITHGNAVQNAENCSRTYRAALGDDPLRSLIAVPLSHITGCNSQMVTTVHSGGTSIIMPFFTVEAFLDAVSAWDINACIAVPTIWWRVINSAGFTPERTAGLRSVMYGGAPTPPELVLDLKRAFPRAVLQNLFGATECTGLHTALPDRFATSHNASVGVPMPVCEIRIDEPDHNGVGELLVRGPNVTRGYWNRPDANATAFTADGWFRMGDLARIDADGLLYVVDRLKDMIIRGGEKVFCVEVESVLAAAPNVFEVAVVAVPDPDLGELVGAIISPAPGTVIDLDEVLNYARHHLSRHKVPELWLVSDGPLPRNAGGKLRKNVLRQDLDWSNATSVRHRRDGHLQANRH